MASLPSIPTDSLYKFIALFGIVLLGFGLWYPEKMFRAADADMREALKAQDLARIKVERKKAQVARIMEKLNAKTAELSAERKVLDEAKAELDSKNRALSEESARVANSQRKNDLVALTRRTKSVTSDTKAFVGKLNAYTDRVNRLTDEKEALIPRQEEVLDELASENVILKTSTQAVESLTLQARSWFYMQNGSVVLGFVLIVLGFLLWQFRVQRYQDAILRRQANSNGSI